MSLRVWFPPRSLFHDCCFAVVLACLIRSPTHLLATRVALRLQFSAFNGRTSAPCFRSRGPDGPTAMAGQEPPSAQQPLDVQSLPAELLDAVSRARPPCTRFANTGRCKKGAKCRFLHVSKSGHELNRFRLPYMSLENGQMMLRPPVGEALARFFSEAGVRNPLETGSSWIDPNNGWTMLTYQLQFMQPPDLEACLAASTVGVEGFHPSGSTRVGSWLMHGTSVESALGILIGGSISPGPGIVGEAVYAFTVQVAGDTPTDEEVQATWLRGQTGGYNLGASFLMKRHGILAKITNRNRPDTMPSGVTGLMRDQFGASPGCLEYVAVRVFTWTLWFRT